MSKGRSINLDENELPREWYNILPELPKPLPPPIDPSTRKPVDPRKLERIFAKELIRQELSPDLWIPIPNELRETYLIWRPTPLIEATHLERALKTPARIFFKWEGVSPPGSHKPNTAVAQAYFNMKEGVERLSTETGAGQWGSALSFGCMLFGLKCRVFMVRVSYNQKPYRRVLMETWGAEVFPSPSDKTNYGRSVLSKDPNHPGSLGIAISEALEDALSYENARYSLGSVLNHVLIHQTVQGLEAKKQLEIVDEYPDVVVGCVGGGSSFSGLFWPFYHDKVTGKAPKSVEFVATEPTACPTLTKGIYTFDYGDTAKMTPLLPMYTLGSDFVPPPIHAGGLRYHGDAPTLCLLVKERQVKAVAYDQVAVFDAAVTFARTEGYIPAPEPSHTIRYVIDEALRCKRTGEKKTILFNLCGHGYFDMNAYSEYFEGKLQPWHYPEDAVRASIEALRRDVPWLSEVENAYLR
ncbi:MAG: TrpB-like pyridoxal phosphate-dependent enzyme [Aigarchaeota archaeon]|nr:TrpB-like pyridoxal phosphate-dependent enzyme [Aigarchaeota archaeon]MDW8093133.1 TrpB-like pyridoxal phosphate-dependent enzyme [Nitrososphaerota archaeon]